VKDLPACGQTVELWWRKRRLRCDERLCPRRSFTQAAAAVRPRGRVTERLRDKMATAIAGSNRSVADVAAEHDVSWPTAHKALVAAEAIREAAARVLRGESLRSIAFDFNDRGIKPVGGGRWVGSTLRRVLVSPRIAKLRDHRGEIVGEAKWPGSSTAPPTIG
jgi:hypothetical protein